MNWKPTKQPGRYDRERVARLHPIRIAIDDLKLGPLLSPKLGGILNAIELQIELGGDSPEVNQLLLQALRASVLHQVGENKGQPVLRAIETFERTEASRWEQVKAGTLPPIAISPEERLQELIHEGYALLEAKQEIAACDRWLEAWEIVKQIARPEMRTTHAFDQAYPGGFQLVFNWCQDLEMELGNAGIDDPVYHEHRLRYAREFLERFPDEGVDFQINFGRAQAEVLWRLGRRAEAEAVFAAMVERFPDEAEVGHFGLGEPQERRGVCLRQPALLDHAIDLVGKLGLQPGFFGVRNPNVGEHVLASNLIVNLAQTWFFDHLSLPSLFRQ